MLDPAESKQPGSGAQSFASATAREYKADSSRPTTAIQLVLHPRQRVKAIFNLDATVLDVYSHMKQLSGASSFQMITGFPPVALTDPRQTVVEAKLLNASVQQKL